VTDKFALSVDASRLNTDGYVRIAPDEQGAIDRRAKSDSLNTQIKAEYRFSPTFKTYLRGNLFQQDQNQGTQLATDSTYTRDLASGFHWKTNSAGQVNANVFYEDQHFNTTNTDLIGPGRNGEFVSNVHSTPATDAGASLVWSGSFGDVFRLATLGADARQIKGEDRAHDHDPSGNLILSQIGGGKQRSLGLFSEIGVWPISKLELLLSARADQWKNYDGVDDRNPGETARFADKSKTSLNPKLATKYQLTDAWSLRGAVYRSFRAPTLNELYRSFTSSNFGLDPNSQLDPEILTGGDAGIEFGADQFRGQFNVFLNDVKDKIGGTPTSFAPVFTLKNVNIGKTRSRGVEFIEDWRVAYHWTLSGGYTFTDSYIKDNPADPAVVGKKTPGLPEHVATLTVGYHTAEGFAANLRGRYLSARYEDDANTLKSGAAFVLDAYTSYPLTSRMDVYARAENVLDRRYVAGTFGGTQIGAPRQVFGGVRLNF
jgi:outer membrane receptor protein involved in Fe transport